MAYVGEGGIQDIRTRIYRERGTTTLNGSGAATVTLDNPVPSGSTYFVHLTPWITAGDNPVLANVTGWTTSGGNITGFTIDGVRFRALPSPLTLLTQLLGFKTWALADATGARVDWMMY